MCAQDPIRFREFRASDLESVLRLIHDTIDVSYSPVYPARAIQFFKDFHSETKILERHQKGEILILEKDGKPIGTGSLVGSDILGVFVHPRFQRQGYGKDIMIELEKRAALHAVSEVVLSVSLPSKRFYERLGYEITGSYSMDVGESQRLDYWEAKKKWQKGKRSLLEAE
jgi:RimJ/RimL family protein N-acetyltransferase